MTTAMIHAQEPIISANRGSTRQFFYYILVLKLANHIQLVKWLTYFIKIEMG